MKLRLRRSRCQVCGIIFEVIEEKPKHGGLRSYFCSPVCRDRDSTANVELPKRIMPGPPGLEFHDHQRRWNVVDQYEWEKFARWRAIRNRK
jgi:hypothetical protein